MHIRQVNLPQGYRGRAFRHLRHAGPVFFLAGMLILSACTPRVETSPVPAASFSPSATPQPPTPSLTLTISSTPLPTATVVAASTTPTASSTSLAASQPACHETAGRIDSGSISTSLLRKPLVFQVYLPPCYTGSPRRYPVLYLLHGQGYTEDQWIRLGVASSADQLISSGEIQPLLIVMPYDSDWRQPSESGFGDALTSSLIPWIDQNYRTLPERGSRAIGGLSRGAAWAVHVGLSHWELFGAVGAHSPAVFWTDSAQLSRWLDAIPVHLLPRFYLDMGKNDPGLAAAVELENLLNGRAIPHEWYLRPGYHDETYWQAHVLEYLRWYTLRW
jgi:enterochelin esterase-like enzyme